MDWKKKNKGSYFYSIAVIVILLILCCSYGMWRGYVGAKISGFMRPYINLSSISNAALSDKSLLLNDRFTLAKEIETLRRRNKSLEIQGGVAAALMEENRLLRRHISLPTLPQRSYLHCEVIMVDPMDRRNSFSINKGSHDGIQSGDAVIECQTPGVANLVGVIGRVEPYRAQVLSLCNPQLRISARVGNTSNTGFINVGEHSSNGEQIPIGLLPRNFTMQKYQAVVTTGFENAIPAGIKIGEMESMDSNSGFFADKPQKSGFVRVTVNYNNLRFLIVVIRKK